MMRDRYPRRPRGATGAAVYLLTLLGVALAQFASTSPRDPVREAPAPVD